MNHIFKPGDFAYWYEPSYVKNEWVELIANENDVGDNKDMFPLAGTFPITKPMSERNYVLFTLDGRIDPLSPPVLFVNNPFKDENPVKFKHGDKAFYLPEKRWTKVVCSSFSDKIFISENDRELLPTKVTTTFCHRFNNDGTLEGKQVLLDHNPFDPNDPNNPSSCTDECKEEKDADYFLNKAVEILKERGRERDVEKERSMARIVSVYNALTGQSMSVEDGWKFMAILKLVRIQIKPHEDGFLDALSYIALWGEEFFNNETTKGE